MSRLPEKFSQPPRMDSGDQCLASRDRRATFGAARAESGRHPRMAMVTQFMSFTGCDDQEDALDFLRKADWNLERAADKFMMQKSMRNLGRVANQDPSVSFFLESTSTTDPVRARTLLDKFDGDVMQAVNEHFHRLELSTANGDSPRKGESSQPAMMSQKEDPAVAQFMTYTGTDRTRAVECLRLCSGDVQEAITYHFTYTSSRNLGAQLRDSESSEPMVAAFRSDSTATQNFRRDRFAASRRGSNEIDSTATTNFRRDRFAASRRGSNESDSTGTQNFRRDRFAANRVGSTGSNEQSRSIPKFLNVTRCNNVELARDYLKRTSGNWEKAVELFMEEKYQDSRPNLKRSDDSNPNLYKHSSTLSLADDSNPNFLTGSSINLDDTYHSVASGTSFNLDDTYHSVATGSSLDDTYRSVATGSSTNLDDTHRSVATGFSNSFTNEIRDKAEAINEVQRKGRRLKHVSEKLKRDKEVVLPAVSNDGSALRYAPRDLRGDPEIILAALQSKGVGALKYATRKLRDDGDFMQSLMLEHDYSGRVIEFASPRLQNEKNLVMCAIFKERNARARSSKGADSPLLYISDELKDDAQLVLEAVLTDGSSLPYASDRLRGNAEIVMAAVSNCGWRILEYAASSLRDDEAFFKTLLEMEGSSGELLQYASARLKSQKDLIMQAISLDQLNKTGDANQPVARPKPHSMLCSFMHASETLKNDREVVMHALAVDGMSLQYASESMKADQTIIRVALQSGGIEVLKHASSLVKDNRCFLESLVDEYGARGQLLKFASNRLKAHKEFIKSLVSKDGFNLADVATSLQGNQEVVEAAIKKDWKALQFASEELRNDKNIVSLAVGIDAFALRFASDELRSNKDLVLAAVKERNFFVLSCAAPRLRDDQFFFQSLLDKHGLPGQSIQYASDRLKGNKKLVLSAVSKDGISLSHAAGNLKNDRDVVRAAVLQDGKAFKYASETLKNDEELFKEAAKQHPQLLEQASAVIKDDPESVLAAVTGDITMLEQASDLIKKRKDFGMEVVAIHGTALRYLANEVKDDKDVVLAAVNTSGASIQYASERLQHDKDVVMAALRQDGNLLESLPGCFRGDKDCVLAAISSQPRALKFALGGLNQDQECLIEAGLWDDENEFDRRNRKIVLSTRFSLAAESSATATEFTVRLKEHPYFRDAKPAYRVYSPNAFNKQTCDPNWTDMSWPCRGTLETCQMEDRSLCVGPPRSECCWRYSYRCHLAKARDVRGFMIQVVELDRTAALGTRGRRHVMGKGQMIEKVMAEQVGTKSFLVYEPGYRKKGVFGTLYDSPSQFRKEDIDKLAKYVEEWYASGCEDMRPCGIHFPRNIDSSRDSYWNDALDE